MATCLACGGGEDDPPVDDTPDTPDAADAPQETAEADDVEPAPLSLVVVTFNTGTSEGMAHDAKPDDGYTSEHAGHSDTWYGDGLAWLPAVAAARAWLAATDPDVIVFQEIFYSGECPDVPPEATVDFVCSTWKAGDPTVAQHILGEGWQVACHPGKSDKCAAVKRSVGTFAGCDGELCLEGLTGATIEGCGKGSRVARGVIELTAGGTVTLVSVHGSSGFDTDTMACRTAQFERIFVDLDGAPAANGSLNLIMGDFNTDPGRAAEADPSAAKLLEHIGDGKDFHFVSEVGLEVTPTYAGIFNIDHVISDRLQGSCWAAGVTDGHPAVIDAVYFDHVPIVCTVTEEPSR